MAPDDWAALVAELDAAPAAKQERLWRGAVFSAAELAQWRYCAPLLSYQGIIHAPAPRSLYRAQRAARVSFSFIAVEAMASLVHSLMFAYVHDHTPREAGLIERSCTMSSREPNSEDNSERIARALPILLAVTSRWARALEPTVLPPSLELLPFDGDVDDQDNPRRRV